jgi:anti-sigma regulatory factor (Ser/Thr protein kinase)
MKGRIIHLAELAASKMPMHDAIELPRCWIEAGRLERALRTYGAPHESCCPEVHFRFPNGCKLMIDAAVRLLSLLNQLDYCGKWVQLDFEEGPAGVMGYLNRMGFFDCLSPNISVLPSRPRYSGAKIYRGNNAQLVEIARINRGVREVALPSRLTSALIQACGKRPDANELEGAAWTIFAELIDNIFSHSETELDGYAALQVYAKGNSLKVAVSDSGLGIMETLRPALKHDYPALSRLSDLNLLVEIFRQGLSRHGADRGCGLKGSAAKAMKFRADLDVRLPNVRVLLTPGTRGYQPNTALCYDRLPLIWGTHICFSFGLDTRT